MQGRINGEKAVLWVSGANIMIAGESNPHGAVAVARFRPGGMVEGDQISREEDVRMFAEDFVAELKTRHQCAC